MIFGLLGRRPRQATAGALYGAIVAQSRRAAFYAEYGVPDTVDGRFDLIVLHQALLFRRLAREAALRDLSQDVFDMFCRDMDGNLREMGIGDLAVPKAMLRFGEAFYGRSAAYDEAALNAGGDALADVLARNVFGQAGPPSAGARRLAAYVTAAIASLDAADLSIFVAGGLPFPDPGAVPAVPISRQSQ